MQLALRWPPLLALPCAHHSFVPEARRRSLAALLFRLERPLAPEEAEGLLGEVSGWFRQYPDQGRLRRLFAELVRKACKGLGVKVPAANDLLEIQMRSNFETIGETWRQQALAEGRAQGKAEALVCLLVERFGGLTSPLRTRIRRANLVTLERWFKRAMVAPDLPSVFD